jgi:hypothetical protein
MEARARPLGRGGSVTDADREMRRISRRHLQVKRRQRSIGVPSGIGTTIAGPVGL